MFSFRFFFRNVRQFEKFLYIISSMLKWHNFYKNFRNISFFQRIALSFCSNEWIERLQKMKIKFLWSIISLQPPEKRERTAHEFLTLQLPSHHTHPFNLFINTNFSKLHYLLIYYYYCYSYCYYWLIVHTLISNRYQW